MKIQILHKQGMSQRGIAVAYNSIVVDNGNDEDASLQLILDGAIQAALDYLNLDEQPDPVPDPVKAAVLLKAGDLYLNREASSDKQYFIKQTYMGLLNPYRVMSV